MTYPPGIILHERYEVLSHLDAGGMGIIYKVRHIHLAKEYALKTLKTSDASSTALRRFQQEAKVLAKFEHPNIVAVADFGVLEDGMPFLVMELLQGQTLDEYVKTKGALPLNQALPIFVQLCDGLAYAHEKGVIHRDIKPSNVMLLKSDKPTDEARVKLLDFGIVKFNVGETDSVQSITKTGEIFGSPLYMSPEQCMGEPLDRRSDIYSLGCLFFECLTGSPPFTSDNSLSTMMKHRNELPPSLKSASLGQEFPEQIEFVIGKMLAKEPEQRFSTLTEVAEQLQSTQVSHVSNNKRLAPPAVSKATTKKYSAALVVSVSVALVVCAIGGVFLLKPGLTGAPQSEDQKPAPAPVVKMNQKEFESSVKGGLNKTESEKKDDQLQIQEKISQLESTRIEFNDKTFTAYEISLIARSPVKGLSLLSCQLQNPDMSQLTNLTELRLARTEITQEDLKDICTLHKLISLAIWASDSQVKDLSPLTKLTKLQRLDLSHSQVSDEVVKKVAPFPYLTNLYINDCPRITDASLKSLEKSTLSRISLAQTAITDDGLASLAKMTRLNRVDIESTSVTAGGVSNLCLHSQSPRLKVVAIDECPKISSLDTRKLATQFPLISFTKEEAKKKFQGATNSESPEDEDSGTTETSRPPTEAELGVLRSRLAEQNKPELQLNGHKISTDVLEILSRKPLTALTFFSCRLFHPDFSLLPKTLTELNFIRTLVSQEQFEAICKLERLEKICFSSAGNLIGNFSSLRKLDKLKSIDLSRSQIQDDQIQQIARLPHLETLFLNGCENLTDEGLAPLPDSNIHRLELADTKISDKGLAILAKIKTLSELNLEKTFITADGINQLCRNSQIHHLTRVTIQNCANVSPKELLLLRKHFPNVRF
ncbi:MAG TPA: protein kinase [Drouetiella sp.]